MGRAGFSTYLSKAVEDRHFIAVEVWRTWGLLSASKRGTPGRRRAMTDGSRWGNSCHCISSRCHWHESCGRRVEGRMVKLGAQMGQVVTKRMDQKDGEW